MDRRFRTREEERRRLGTTLHQGMIFKPFLHFGTNESPSTRSTHSGATDIKPINRNKLSISRMTILLHKRIQLRNRYYIYVTQQKWFIGAGAGKNAG